MGITGSVEYGSIVDNGRGGYKVLEAVDCLDTEWRLAQSSPGIKFRVVTYPTLLLYQLGTLQMPLPHGSGASQGADST